MYQYFSLVPRPSSVEGNEYEIAKSAEGLVKVVT